MSKRLLLRLGFSLLLALLVLLVLEGAYRLRGEPASVWKKSWIQTPDGFGNCYSQDPGDRFPLDLRTLPEPVNWLYGQAIAAAVMQGVAPPSLVHIQRTVRDTPHCLFYPHRNQGSSPERPAKVLLLGDSFTFGEGLRSDETLGYLLDRRFNRYDFINRAVPGVDASYVASAFTAEMQGLRGKAKLAIYFYYLNDAVGLDAAVPPESIMPTPEAHEEAWRQSRGSTLMSWSLLYRAGWDNLERRRITETHLRAVQAYYLAADGRLKETRAALVRMAHVSRDEKVPLLVVIYPILYHDLLGRYLLKEAHDWVLKTCQELKLTCVDGHQAFAQERSLTRYQLNPADAHPNLAANKKMVEFLLPTVTRMLHKR